ncbi:hypothetical protein ACIBCD_43230 [Nocardia brasiliensis]|uniref:hypothetical protein n=1 Tax=Nocardia brasiliensis TaxID=37326 RepID=UPI0037B8F3D9
MTDQAVPVRFPRILGTTGNEIGGVRVDLGGPRTHKVLPVDLGDPVSDDDLIDQAWQDR